MKLRHIIAMLAALPIVAASLPALGFEHGGTTCYGNNARWRASLRPWHGDYYYAQWGTPVALVVPPNAELMTDYTWGVGATEIRRIDHQFQRPFPGYGYGGTGFAPTPLHPSHTRQFGIYPVRGPW